MGYTHLQFARKKKEGEEGEEVVPEGVPGEWPWHLPDEFENWLIDVLRRYTQENVSAYNERQVLISYLSNCRKSNKLEETRDKMRRAGLPEDQVKLYYDAMVRAKKGEAKSKVRQSDVLSMK